MSKHTAIRSLGMSVTRGEKGMTSCFVFNAHYTHVLAHLRAGKASAQWQFLDCKEIAQISQSLVNVHENSPGSSRIPFRNFCSLKVFFRALKTSSNKSVCDSVALKSLKVSGYLFVSVSTFRVKGGIENDTSQ